MDQQVTIQKLGNDYYLENCIKECEFIDKSSDFACHKGAFIIRLTSVSEIRAVSIAIILHGYLHLHLTMPLTSFRPVEPNRKLVLKLEIKY
ncbi:hypothetical protein TNCV_3268831 [Trichonephila clavipes]|nr:hypothetical protein TNCV_3268831 [Trichonephila clavipes]